MHDPIVVCMIHNIHHTYISSWAKTICNACVSDTNDTLIHITHKKFMKTTSICVQ